MQNIEESALSTYRQTIPLWLRNVDDTFTAVRQDEIVAFHRHLNGQNTDIQFTREDESKCIEYKQGTVGNWLPIAANECVCVCVCVCGVVGGGGVVRILQSLMGVIRSIYHIEEPKSSFPHPSPPGDE